MNQSVDSNFVSGLLPDDWSRVSQRGGRETRIHGGTEWLQSAA